MESDTRRRRMNCSGTLLHFLAIFCLLTTAPRPIRAAFYIPGVAPVEFKEGDPIEVKAVKMTSVRTQLPYEYYELPFCSLPPEQLVYKSENLGEILRGDRIVNTPFKVEMKKDKECHKICEKVTMSKKKSKMMADFIAKEYYVHLLVDNLPCATLFPNVETGETQYEHGYRLGFVSEDKDTKKKRYFVNNHLSIILRYHTEDELDFRVVGFEVRPASFAIEDIGPVAGEPTACSLKAGQEQGLEVKADSENDILFTYDVKWQRSDVKWASRWDTYLEMGDAQIHWFSIINSIVVVFFLAGILTMIIVRTLRRDIARYNRDEEYDDTLEETGWKLVHGDVFRPPRHAILFASILGAGIQIFGMTFVTVGIAMLGMLSPSSRGKLISTGLFLFMFFGLIAGYFSARLYKTMRGTMWKRAAMRTATLYPGIMFGICFFLNFFIWGKGSSGSVPLTTMVALLSMWIGISVPLVYLGYFFGFRKQSYEHPVRTNQIPRQVPEQPWYMTPFFSMMMAGILPFGAMFIELFFIFSAIWENQFYYLFGFLFLVFLILIVACSQISIVMVYFQLCGEDYHWWWRSFLVSGGSAIYVFAYSVFYFVTKLDMIGFVPTLLYFGYTSLIVFTFWLLTGTIGFFSAYAFIRRIYAAVKID